MSQFLMDFFFLITFVVFILLFIRIKDRTFSKNKDSYYYALFGMFVLFLVAALRMADHQNMLTEIPVLNEAAYNELIQAIGIFAGLALMIAGISIWVPVRRKNEEDLKSRLRRYSVIPKIESEIYNAPSVNKLFDIAPALICNEFDFYSSAVFRMYHKSNQLVCTNCYCQDEEKRKSFSKMNLKMGRSAYTFAEIRDSLGADFYLTIDIQKTARAAIFFWFPEKRTLNTDDKIMLERITRAISNRINEQLLTGKLDYYERTARYLGKIKEIVGRRLDMENIVRELHTLFKAAFHNEYISLAVMDKSRGSYRRYTVGNDNRILLEDGARIPIKSTHIDKIIKTKRSYLFDDISTVDDENFDPLFSGCDQRSMISAPIINYGRVIGVLTIGHSRASRFMNSDLQRIEQMAQATAPAIEAEISRRTVFERDRYLAASVAFGKTLESCADIDSVMQAAAKVLSENIGTTMVRLTSVDESRSTLITRALKTIRPLSYINDDKVNLSDEITPRHKKVLNTNKLLLVNQNDPDSIMKHNEAQLLAFEGIRSVLIVPIMLNNFTFGMITLGEMRDWERFSYDSATIMFCQDIASKVGDSIKMYRLSQALRRSEDEAIAIKKNRINESEVLRQLQTPLSNIRGSIDMLRIKHIGGRALPRKLLDTMDNSTREITRLMTGGGKIVEEKENDLVEV